MLTTFARSHVRRNRHFKTLSTVLPNRLASRPMQIHRLRLLRAVAQAGSFSAAATELSYATSSVSEQVTALEREVGLPLLERRRRGVRPTAAGALLLEHAERILAEGASAEA